jgi:hypothetical protein
MKHLIAKSILAMAAGAGTFAIPTFAKADHLDRFHVDYRRDRDRDRDCDRDVRRVWVEPVYEERTTQVWVEPVYRCETVPVWVNEYYETKCDKVWVEPVYEVREVVRYERGRRCCARERVCVRPGGWQTVERKVCVPGHYRHEERQVLVTPGHYENKCERVCVREGRWDTVERERPHFDRDRDRVSVGFDIRGRF